MAESSLDRRSLILGSMAALVSLPRVGVAQVGYGPSAQIGDLVVCPRNHPIATLSRSLVPGDPIGLSAFTQWQIPEPRSLRPAPPCPVCGKGWYVLQRHNFGRPQVIVRGKGLQPAA